MTRQLNLILIFFLISWPLFSLPAAEENPVNTQQVIDYLLSITGTKAVAGEHNSPDEQPRARSQDIFNLTGKYPGFWSCDFHGSENPGRIKARWNMVLEAEHQWKRGCIVQFMWHHIRPDMEKGGFKHGVTGVPYTDEEWKQLITPGTPLNGAWLTRVDELVPYFQYLKDHHVPILFRPYHEMNQVDFWWGGHPGPNGTVRLYQLLHDRLVKYHGLTNIIWVWDIQDFGWRVMSKDLVDFNPGADYWDILAFDVYDKSGYTMQKYQDVQAVVGKKPMGIGECAILPSAEELASQPRWCFFMGWSDLAISKTGPTAIKKLYANSRIITQDQMPGWK